MDVTEVICHAARTEAHSFRSARSADGVNPKLPYFCIARRTSSSPTVSCKYDVSGYNFAGHDNAPRMGFLCDYLKASVLPYVDNRIDVSGYYNVELHDSYSYLPNADDYRNCLTFSRRRKDAHMTLLPNPYQMGNYGGQFDSASDTVAWDKKQDLLFFAGSSTGCRDPLHNARIQACQWSLLNRGVSKFTITNLVQMSEAAYSAAVPEGSTIMSPPVPMKDNYNYKYLVNIVGNTCAWSRVPMALASKSLLVNVYHEDMEWFYPYLLEGTHFLGCGMHTLLSKRAFAASNPQIVQYIIANANRFYSAFLGRNQAALYTVQLLEEIAARSRP
jgi:Glycosyl transferase family 90